MARALKAERAEDYPLTIGSHSFIDTFEEQLIGKKIGEECEVNVTFPTRVPCSRSGWKASYL